MSQIMCGECHSYFESRRADSKLCSAKCRKKASRAKNYIGQPGGAVEKVVKIDLLDRTPEGLGETDRLFYMDSLRMGPDWIKFSDDSWERDCYICRNKYRTRLSLLKFCRPACRKEFLSGTA